MQRPADLTRPELQYAVEQLQRDYVECIDDDRLEAWPEFFTESCLYQVIARENADRELPVAAMHCDSRGMLRDRVVALRHANIYARHYYRHLVSNINIKAVEDDAVRVQSNYVVMQTLLDGTTHIYNAGRYLDKIEFGADGAKFREKVAIFDTYRIPNLMVTPI